MVPQDRLVILQPGRRGMGFLPCPPSFQMMDSLGARSPPSLGGDSSDGRHGCLQVTLGHPLEVLTLSSCLEHRSK